MLNESYKRIFSMPPILFFSLIMLLKGALAWLVIFENGASWMVMLKELPFVLIVFSLIEAFAKKRKMLYYLIANLLMTTILFAVIMYYKYYGVIVTYFALAQVNQVTAVKNSVFSLMDPYFLFIFTDVVVLAALMIKKKRDLNWKTKFNTPSSRKVALALLTVSLIVCLFNIVPNRASMNEIVKAEQMGILNYEAYMIFSNKDQEYVEPEKITQANINKLKNVQQVEQPLLHGSAQGKNLIIIQMESLQNFLVNLKVEGQEILPNFNKLVNEHYYFDKFYQQVGQGNTSDAEYVVNTSLYIPPRGAATQMYADRELPSIAKLLKKHNYVSTTFHTNVVEFWNRGELYESLGFDSYYDAKYFGDEDTVFFGASDEVLYRKTLDQLEQLNEADQRFYAQVISMTAHHPYTMPEEKQLIELPERYKNTLVGNYLIAQYYADQQLGKFIEDLKESGLWDNSLIVLYGDHLGLPIYSLDNHEMNLMKEMYGRDYTYTDMINIPLVVINEGTTEGKVFSEIGGQVDILPTVANLLGVSLEDQIHFGQDIFNTKQNLLPQRYYLPTGSFLTSEELFLSGSGYEDGKHYSLSDASVGTDGASEEEFQRSLELLKMSDSYVNSLPLKPGKTKEEK